MSTSKSESLLDIKNTCGYLIIKISPGKSVITTNQYFINIDHFTENKL